MEIHMPVEQTATPLPWATSDLAPHLVFHDNLGVVDVDQPVASFKYASDAGRAVKALDLVQRAIPIIETEREVLFSGHQVNGVLKIDDDTDQEAIDAIGAMDEWLSVAREIVGGGAD
jgi:hypothetical protein